MSEQVPSKKWDGPREGQAYVLWLEEQLRDLAKPAHEREPPHCSTCGCGLSMTARSLDDQALLAIAKQWDQGSGSTFEFDAAQKETIPIA